MLLKRLIDYVNLLLLFKKLLQRDMCPIFLRFLMNTNCNLTNESKIEWYDFQHLFY